MWCDRTEERCVELNNADNYFINEDGDFAAVEIEMKKKRMYDYDELPGFFSLLFHSIFGWKEDK